jgi:hypothetical protein
LEVARPADTMSLSEAAAAYAYAALQGLFRSYVEPLILAGRGVPTDPEAAAPESATRLAAVLAWLDQAHRGGPGPTPAETAAASAAVGGLLGDLWAAASA